MKDEWMLSYANKDDGTFWIEYKDFCAHMTKVRMRRPHLGRTPWLHVGCISAAGVHVPHA